MATETQTQLDICTHNERWCHVCERTIRIGEQHALVPLHPHEPRYGLLAVHPACMDN